MGVPNKFVDASIALKKIVPLQEETNMLMMFPRGSHFHFIPNYVQKHGWSLLNK
jgi:hypothetical protein